MPVATPLWFNTVDYPVPLLVLFGIGCFGWVVAYVAIARNARRSRFLERLSHRVIDWVPEGVDDTVGRLFLQGMIHKTWDGEVTWTIPDTLGEVRRLA